ANPGEDTHRVHVGMLTLAWTHAHGGIALEQFDVVEALLRRIEEVPELQVLIEVHEILSGRMGENWVGMARFAALALDRRLRGQHAFSCTAAGVFCSLKPGSLPIPEFVLEVVYTIDPPGRIHTLRQLRRS